MGVLRNNHHELFAQGLARGMLVPDAYAAAGYVPNIGNATRLHMNVAIKARIEELLCQAAKRTTITVERVLLEMGRIAFADPRAIFQPDGSIKPMAEWPDDVARAVASVSRDALGRTTVRLWDKPKALELLGRSLAMFTDKLEVKRPTDDMTDDELADYIAHLRSQLGRPSIENAGS